MKIQLVNSKWLINGKSYDLLTRSERAFFDQFLIAMRINYGAQKHDELISKES